MVPLPHSQRGTSREGVMMAPFRTQLFAMISHAGPAQALLMHCSHVCPWPSFFMKYSMRHVKVHATTGLPFVLMHDLLLVSLTHS